MSALVERIIAARDRAKQYRDRDLLDALADAANAITERDQAFQKLVEGLRWSVTELEEWDQYQRRPSRNEWGVECACCMGEMFDKDALERITGFRELLKELGQ
jgi:hypothetical protein